MLTPANRSFQFSKTNKLFFGICAVLGALCFGIGAWINPARAWPNFLLNFFYFTMISLCGVFFTALQHVTNAYWSVSVRRVAEGLMSYLPIAFILAFVGLLGQHYLYEWSHAHEVAKDHLLQLKRPYLNSIFFILRFVFFFIVWIWFGFKMRQNSLLQDQDGKPTHTLSNIKLSCIFLPLFGVTLTLFSFDFIMSIEPHWFSTIFGVYCFAGLFWSGLCMMVILITSGQRQGVFSTDVINENHLHDLGKLMFAFTVFWAYIFFSQFMLQWYANLPEETSYYLRRGQGGWFEFGAILFIFHFIIPFFGLLPRNLKRNPVYLRRIAFFMLFAQWLDVYYLVMPVFFKEGPVFGWVEVGTFLGFLGLFMFSISRFLEKVPAVPLKDPRFQECLAHHQ